MTAPTAQAVIHMDRVAANFASLSAHVSPAGVCCAVKANAYGHGAVEVAALLWHLGVRMLAVATAGEALEIADAAGDTPILLFGPVPPDDVEDLVAAGVRLTVSSTDEVRLVREAARATAGRPVVHVNVDTGMGRVGVTPAGLAQLVTSAHDVDVEGVYTHLPSADETDDAFTREQVARFASIIDGLRTGGVEVPIVHAANSAAVMTRPESRFDMVRVGISLYGLYPDVDCARTVDVAPAMTLESVVAQVRDLPTGSPVSYGRTFVTKRPTRAGVVTVGYADGYSRALSGAAVMQVRGAPAPVLGRVCMDLTMIDLTDIPGARTGDRAVVYSHERGDANSVEALARTLGTIPYEIVTTLGRRVERRHIDTP